MQGWKTWVGVLGFVASYVAASILNVDMTAAQDTATSIIDLVEVGFGALTVIGIGHKIEKSRM